MSHYFRDLHANGEKQVESWLADPPGSVLYSYVTSGGKLKEREGGSITEGELQLPSSMQLANWINQALGKVVSRITLHLR